MKEQSQGSVVIAVYNGARHVARALDSVFAQSLPPSEVIVVDDGSTDSTQRVLEKYGGRIKVIRQGNKGLATARNVGVAAASAQYVAFLDADDVWLPQRLERTFAALDPEPGAVLAYSNAVRVNERDEPTADSHVPADKARAPSVEELLEGWGPILPSSALIRREAYLAVGGFREQFKGPGGFDDVFFFLLIRERGPFVYVSEPLVRYRRAPFVDRMEKYAAGFLVFSRLVSERYGAAGSWAIKQQAEVYSRLLAETGVEAIAAGQMKQARRALLCATRYKRPDRRTILRLLRAYLPGPLALALTSNRRRAGAGLGASADHLSSN